MRNDPTIAAARLDAPLLRRLDDPLLRRLDDPLLRRLGAGGIDGAVAQARDDDAIFGADVMWPLDGQAAPPGDWLIWLIVAGRGFGKTRAGAAWIDEVAVSQPGSRIALVGATMADARSVMIEGESGLLALNPGLRFEPSRGRVEWPGTGSVAHLFSAEEPGRLRGPSFGYAWGDEAARWERGPDVVANLRMALRVGMHPRLLLTTTPKPLAWLKRLAVAEGVVAVRGRTRDNMLLPRAFQDAMLAEYGGTRLGRQEIDGEFIDAAEGALWSHAQLDAGRIACRPTCTRIVVGVDPPAGVGAHVDACGIVVAGLLPDGRGAVLADRSVQGLTPENWARAVVAAFDEYSADLVVAEVNNGGAMVTAVLRGVDDRLNVREVRAAQGKVARAEPVAALYAQGKVVHAGVFEALEDELCGLSAGGGWHGPGRSPDRADACVWALTELMLGPVRADPGVRSL